MKALSASHQAVRQVEFSKAVSISFELRNQSGAAVPIAAVYDQCPAVHWDFTPQVVLVGGTLRVFAALHGVEGSTVRRTVLVKNTTGETVGSLSYDISGAVEPGFRCAPRTRTLSRAQGLQVLNVEVRHAQEGPVRDWLGRPLRIEPSNAQISVERVSDWRLTSPGARCASVTLICDPARLLPRESVTFRTDEPSSDASDVMSQTRSSTLTLLVVDQ